MENDRFVLDANVFLEYIYDRPLQEYAKKILHDGILRRVQILIPSLLLDEISEVLCGNLDDLEEVKNHLLYIEELAKQDILHIVVPNTEVRMKAIEIARMGNPKSGYPEWTDSLYHALAIFNDAIFITNDTKHLNKVKMLGHIEELAKFRSISE